MAFPGILANAHDFNMHQPTMIDQSNSTHITQEVIFNKYACDSGRISPITMAVPCSSQLFTGYETYLEMLRIRLLDENEDNSIRKYFLLYGMGGVGKTQICLKFKDDMEDYFKYIFWVDSTSEDSIVQSLRNVYKAHNSAQATKFSANDVLTWISFLKCKWLMIFDNADGPAEALEKYIPAGNKGAILITSRNHELRRITTNRYSAEVSGLNCEASILLLLRSSGLEEAKQYETVASEIVSELCHLPLAIAQAGAYIMGSSCDITEYLAIYRMHRAKLLSRESFGYASKYEKSVYGTWEISFQKLVNMVDGSDRNKAHVAKCAIKIINVSCFLHHQHISTSIFERAARYYKAHVKKFDKDIRPAFINTMDKDLFDMDEAGQWNKFVFYEAISALTTLSLIKRDDSKHFTLHPLVKDWCQDRLLAEERNYWRSNAEGMLAASITNNDSREEYIYNQDILLHILAILSQRQHVNGLGYQYDILINFSNALGRCGKHISEEKLRRDMLIATKELLGDTHPSTLKSMTDLAVVLSDLGKWKDAEELEVEVLKMTVTLYRREHPKTLRSMTYLAITYSNLGKWELAEKLDFDVFRICITHFGEEHTDTLHSMASLAVTYSEMGMWGKAEKLEENVLGILIRLKGAEHSDTLHIMINLSATYSNLGKWVDAEKLQIQILTSYTRIFGEDHPNTVQSMAYLAASYSNLGKWEMAETLQKKVLELRTKIYGEDHLNTLRSMSKLGRTYSDLGKWVEAEEILTKSLEKMTALYGEDHYDTCRVMANLARNYSDIWKWNEAEKLQVRVLEMRIDTLGKEHFTTLRSMTNLARTYSYQGKWKMAEALQVHALERLVKVHGHKHPDVLLNMNQLGVIYSHISKVERAQQLQLDAFRGMAQNLGEEHPDTLLCMGNLSNTYVRSKDLGKAEPLQRSVIDISSRVYGDQHPLTLTALYNLGYTFYSQQNNMQEAETLIHVALRGRLQMYGSQHPATMECVEVLQGIRGFMDHPEKDKCRIPKTGWLTNMKKWFKIN